MEKTAEEILKQYYRTPIDVSANKNIERVEYFYHEEDVYKAMEEYAQQAQQDKDEKPIELQVLEDMLNKPMSKKSKDKIRKVLQSRPDKDWKCHCGDKSTGSTKIWACNICGMEVPDEHNPDKISAKLKQESSKEIIKALSGEEIEDIETTNSTKYPPDKEDKPTGQFGEDYPVYDENYLNECIKKAKPNLSKIKDVDKTLDEIRGIESDKDAIIAKQEELIKAKDKLIKKAHNLIGILCNAWNLNIYNDVRKKVFEFYRLEQELQTLKSK